MKLGVHVSVAGGVDQAVDRAVELGCNTFQIFVSNPRGWKPTYISDEEIRTFRIKYIAAKMEDSFAHGIYLINLASENESNREQSIESLIAGMKSASRLGLIGLVTHIGSRHDLSTEKGIVRVVEAVESILSESPSDTALLLENTAGAGNLIGDKFEEIGEIINRVGANNLGFCLDTAHAFESGYPIHTEEGLNEVLDNIDKVIGLEKLRAIHLNDSMTEFGSHKDRHETFGKGFIGEEGLTRLIRHPLLRNKPFAMETPELKHGEAGREIVDYVRHLGES